ncbi:MAG: type II toxin-antitoxin system RelE/ParE family toxin [Lachnospiraceae bacterium]|nr:type II toxin-antitoxin system RelE/ParE family toxin [Lachnospiraceae bacterium]
MKDKVIRTETADAHIRKIILYIAENLGNKAALKKLEELEQSISGFRKSAINWIRTSLSGV